MIDTPGVARLARCVVASLWPWLSVGTALAGVDSSAGLAPRVEWPHAMRDPAGSFEVGAQRRDVVLVAFRGADDLLFDGDDSFAARAGGSGIPTGMIDPEREAILAFNRGDAPPPTPEPATWALMAAGLGLLALRRRPA